MTRRDANRCFVCGPDNPAGLGLNFTLDGARCFGEFTPADHLGGFDDVTHGGIVFAVLDDAMANWFFLQGARGYTARSEIRYRAPLPLGTPTAVECRLKQRRRRLVQLEAVLRARDDDTVFAESEASFMLEPGSELDDA